MAPIVILLTLVKNNIDLESAGLEQTVCYYSVLLTEEKL